MACRSAARHFSGILRIFPGLLRNQLLQERLDVSQQLVLIGEGASYVMECRIQVLDGLHALHRVRPAADGRLRGGRHCGDRGLRCGPGHAAAAGLLCHIDSSVASFLRLVYAHFIPRGTFSGWRCRRGCVAGPCSPPGLPSPAGTAPD